MGLLKGAVVVAALLLTGPVWAGGGHGHDRERDDHRGGGRHHYWRGHDRAPEWRHYRDHRRHWDRAPQQYYYNQHYYAPPPAYGYVAPAPGVHIVTPDIYIPLR
jgi:hypothetical protein